MACGHTAIRQSCIIFIYNGVPPTYDTSPKMLLVRIWPKTVLFFVSAKFYWKTIWNTLAHFLALWTMNMTNLDSFDFALYCISGALWFGTGRRLSSNYDTKIFWHIFLLAETKERIGVWQRSSISLLFPSSRIAQKSRIDCCKKVLYGTLWWLIKSKWKNKW